LKTSTENNYRRALRLPEFWVTDPVAWFAHVEAHFELENLTSQQHRYFNVVKPLSCAQIAAKPPAALLSAAFVYVRKGGTIPPLSPLYSGSYRVLASGPKVFRLQVGQREEIMSIDRLKPHRGAAPVQPAQPPSRGRPRAG
jgi:hypothetical protein